ncbi:hypothetical protein PF011_g27370, partial [Phytophthora fragariae]
MYTVSFHSRRSGSLLLISLTPAGFHGCIDGSHIPISNPSKNGEMYYNRKCWYSVVLQAVVDWRGRFCDLDCKWPGRVGD